MIKLYRHQDEAVKFLEKNNLRGYIGLPPGLGKTLIAAWLIKKYKPKRALIIAPKPAYPVWKKELERLQVPHQTYIIYTYEKFLSEHKSNGKNPYYTDFLVLDEAHRIKNIRAKTTRLLLSYGKFRIPKILLSGTPFKELIDLYTQFFVINPGIFGRWREFVDTYFERKTNPFGGIEYVPKEGAEKEILEKISPYFFKKEREEIKELEKIEVFYDFRTPQEFSWEALKKEVAREIYEEAEEYLDDEKFLEEFMEVIKGKFIQFYRKAELANSDKHEFIREFVRDYPDTVVFTYFVDEACLLSRMFDCYLITGKTQTEKREEALKKQDKPIVMTCALSEGANLDSYGNLIFSTVPSSPIKFSQVAGRIDRLSQQRKKVTYVYLLDEYNRRMLDLLKGRTDIYRMFSELLKPER